MKLECTYARQCLHACRSLQMSPAAVRNYSCVARAFCSASVTQLERHHDFETLIVLRSLRVRGRHAGQPGRAMEASESGEC